MVFDDILKTSVSPFLFILVPIHTYRLEANLTLDPLSPVTVNMRLLETFLLASNKGEAQGRVGRLQPQPPGICIKSTSSDGLILRLEMFWLSDRRR